MISGHGNDIYDYDGKIRFDFSSNIPYRNAAEEIAAHLKKRLQSISDYPDANARELTEKIADKHRTLPKNILVTNGSAEAFYLLAHLFRGKKSLIPCPAFAEYEDACRIYGHSLSFFPINSFARKTRFHADTVWFGTPNNPDGTIIGNETVSRFCQKNQQTILIADTAYGELCPQCEPLDALQKTCENLIGVHSLTKTFGIPGLRLGYIIARSAIIEKLNRLRTPWSVNALALEAGGFIMDHYDELLPDSHALCRESAGLQQQLARFPQLQIIHSPCSFFLVKMKDKTAAELKSFLIERFGILIRDASNFRGLSPQHFRIAVREESSNKKLLAALQSFFTK